jgi:hypothetical protein
MTPILGVRWGSPQEDGACPLEHVVPGGPADNGGAEAYDVVATIDGELALDRRRRWANGTCPKQIGVPMAWEVLRISPDGVQECLTLTVAFEEKADPSESAAPAVPAPAPRPLGGGDAEEAAPVYVPPSDVAVSLRPSPISVANGTAPPPSASPLASNTRGAYLDPAQRQAFHQRVAFFRQRGMSAAEAEQIAARPISNAEMIEVAMDRLGVRAPLHEDGHDYNPYARSL